VDEKFSVGMREASLVQSCFMCCLLSLSTSFLSSIAAIVDVVPPLVLLLFSPFLAFPCPFGTFF
jgi:hypothetical protein